LGTHAIHAYTRDTSGNDAASNVITITVSAPPPASGTAPATLSWDPPKDSAGNVVTVDGYRVHYGTASGQYTQSVEVSNVLTHAVTGLASGKRWYFAVTSVKGGAESVYSNEVSKQP
jgi:hypothetical protein